MDIVSKGAGGAPTRHPIRAPLRFLHMLLALLVAFGVFLRERIRLRGKGRESRQRAAGRAMVGSPGTELEFAL